VKSSAETVVQAFCAPMSTVVSGET
jgi:hypothetical protein